MSLDPITLSVAKAYTDEKVEKAATGNVDLSSYAKKTDLPKNTSQLNNDSGFMTNTEINILAGQLKADIINELREDIRDLFP